MSNELVILFVFSLNSQLTVSPINTSQPQPVGGGWWEVGGIAEWPAAK